MAGYIVTMGSEEGLRRTIERGAYGTLLSRPTGSWKQHHEGTFADYVTMSPGDDIYFFVKRRLYGIGQLTEVNGRVAHANSPDAHVPEPFTNEDELLIETGTADREVRFFCTFRPEPAFFAEGVDMDDLLESAPSAFRMLRVLWKRSFVKVDDDENQALRDLMLRRAHGTAAGVAGAPAIVSRWESSHAELRSRTLDGHRLSAAEVLAACADGERIGHEMALEAGLLQQLATRDGPTLETFGDWDFLTHQVPASPFKPVDYMDFIDVFGYRFIPGYRPTIAQYLVAELKRGAASRDDVHQLMKYVDWVRSEYAAGDYGQIKAFLVALDFDAGASEAATTDGHRRYSIGRRPPQPMTWRDLTLVRYRFGRDGRLHFAPHDI